MSTEPRISVIVAAYNYGHVIADALRSVEAQTMGEWECIVVDDASTDHTPAVVKEFVERDPRFRYHRLEQNVGVAAVRNKGIELAHGTYLQMLDADDVIAPEKLARHAAFLDAHPEVDIVYSDLRPFTDVPDLRGPGVLPEDEKPSGDGDVVLARLVRGNIFRMNTLLLRASVVRDAGAFRPEFRHIEDWELWARMAAGGARFHFLDDPACMSGVRDSPGSLSKDIARMRGNVLPLYRHLWRMKGISARSRWRIVVRYADVLLEQVLVRRAPGRSGAPGGVLPWAGGALAVLISPFWLLARLPRSRR